MSEMIKCDKCNRMMYTDDRSPIPEDELRPYNENDWGDKE